MDLVCVNQLFSKGLEIYQKCPLIISGNGSNLPETSIQLSLSKPIELNISEGNLLSNFTVNYNQTQLQLIITSLLQLEHLFRSTFTLFALSIPFRLFSVFFDISSFYLFLITAILLFALLRHRLHFWRHRGLPFESLTAHLNYFSKSNCFSLNDLSRVRRHGCLFGTFHLLRPVLCVADHRVVEQVLFTKADCFTVQKTWQLEGHLLSQSIFSSSSQKSTKSTGNLDEWKRKKALLLSAFLSRKIKLLGPTVDGLSSQLLAYITSSSTKSKSRKKKKTSFQTSLDALTTPFLVYSLCTLILDLDLPPFRRFVEHEGAEALLSSCRRYLEASRSVRQSPLLQMLTPWIPKRHLLDNAHKQALTALLTQAIDYRVENDLIGLPLESTGSKRPSKRRSVKFRKKLVEFKCIEPTPERDQDEQQPPSPPPTLRPSSSKTPAKQLKELTFIDILLDEQDLDTELEPEDKLLEKGKDTSSLNRDELISNLLAFFTVGLSTLSGALTSVLYYLAAYPKEQEKVRTEIINCLQDHRGNRPFSSTSKISWEELRTLKYTEAVIREALRLTSPVERLERVVTKHVTLDSEDFGPLELPPGTLVHILLSALHRDAEYFPEPLTFKPSRFYNANSDNVEGNQNASFEDAIAAKYLAFGMGARTCVGLKFAVFYLKHLVANVLEQYEVRLVDRRWYHLPLHNNHPLDSLELASRQIELLSLENKK